MKQILNAKKPAIVLTGVLVLLAGLLLLKAISTLDWRMEHDTPLLHYAAFLMDEHGASPYRDIYETSMPGSFAFHYLICRLFGYGDFAFRCVDLVVLYFLLAVTYIFMRRFGRFAAASAIIAFALMYLAGGQIMSLQRDFIGIVPVALALLCIPAGNSQRAGTFRFAAVGALFGMSVLIKPHLGLGLPIVLGTLLALRWSAMKKPATGSLVCLAVSGACFAIPMVAALLWLYATSALADFCDMFTEYLPIYCTLTGWHGNIPASDCVLYLVEMTLQFGNFGIMLMCALFGVHRVISNGNQRKPVAASFACLLLCTAAYAIYPALGGKFWHYHYVPFMYFCAMLAGLCFFAWPEATESQNNMRSNAWPVLVFLLALTIQLNLPRFVSTLYADLHSGTEAHAPKDGRVDEMAVWLTERLNPGDTVQPLDWTGGSIHAMLIAKAPLATKFMYDYYFYHHVSSPVIQNLRRIFISQLRAAGPRFIIEVQTNKPWVSGLDSSRSFPELEQYVNENYAVAFEGDGYSIFERTDLMDDSG